MGLGKEGVIVQDHTMLRRYQATMQSNETRQLKFIELSSGVGETCVAEPQPTAVALQRSMMIALRR